MIHTFWLDPVDWSTRWLTRVAVVVVDTPPSNSVTMATRTTRRRVEATRGSRSYLWVWPFTFCTRLALEEREVEEVEEIEREAVDGVEMVVVAAAVAVAVVAEVVVVDLMASTRRPRRSSSKHSNKVLVVVEQEASGAEQPWEAWEVG